MLLKLYYVWTAAVLRALGARRVKHEVGDTTLLCYEIGPPDGERWVLLHGLGATALAWIAAVKRLQKEVKLLIPELSVLGGTVCPNGGLNVVEGSEAVTALIEWWAPGRAVTLAGISLGGWMSVRVALERPDLLERLVLVDAGGYRDQDWERIQDLTTVAGLDDVDRLYQALFHRTPFVIELSRRGFLQVYSSPAVRHVLRSTTPDHAYGPEDLATIRQPTLLLWGEHDGLFSLEVARAMEHHLSHSWLVTLPDAGHAIHWEKPGQMAGAIDRFRLQGLQQRSDGGSPGAHSAA
ncbi:MAG: alpha/beta hydrolase [bacterium]|nr:alpha/beta hydrolase [bacterium]